MYKLMIVDDEPEIREGLIEAADFPSLGYEIVGAVENGVEGLQLAEIAEPDLVITDIRMPLMDGLTMAGRIRKILPTVQFLVLSGHDEFEYARQAIGISALNYLLKPVTKRELLEVMRSVKEKMDHEFKKRTDLTRLREHFEASLPVVRESLLCSLTEGGISPEDAAEAAARYGMPLSADAYAIALIQVGGKAAAISDPELVSVAIRNISGEVLARRQPGYTFHLNGALAVLLLLKDASHASAMDAAAALDEIIKSAGRYIACPLIIGISAPGDGLSSLKNCKKQAETALGYANALGKGQVISFLDIAPTSQRPVIAEDFLLKTLSDGIKMGDKQKALAAVNKLLSVPKITPMTIRDYRAYLLEILMTFLRIGRDLDISPPQDRDGDIYEQLFLCPPIDTAATLIERICDSFVSSVAEKRVASSKLLISEATAFISANYSDENMSIEKLAQHIHISTSYLSAIFRKELDKTFIAYLTEVRMSAAVNLLATTDMKTAEICGRVGISDPSYFSYAFKKFFGVSPSQARKGQLHAQ